MFEPGVSQALEPLLSLHGSVVIPVYDLAYLKWQIEECPALHSVTCVSTAADAAALCWARKDGNPDWRVALWSGVDASERAGAVLRAVLRYVYDRGAHRVSAIVSRHDRARVSLLRSHGFVDSVHSRSLYVTSRMAFDAEVAGLSFVDGDLAYRF
jgi:hypothetical protein